MMMAQQSTQIVLGYGVLATFAMFQTMMHNNKRDSVIMYRRRRYRSHFCSFSFDRVGFAKKKLEKEKEERRGKQCLELLYYFRHFLGRLH
jgi:hypothetical protein